MTSPEWEAANEDDSDRFPQPSPHVAPPPPVDPLQSDPARVARYAEAIFHSQDGWPIAWADLHEDVQAGYLDEAKVAIALADEERAALVAELKQVRKQWHQEVENFERETLRAESAVAEVERLRVRLAKVEALADEWDAESSKTAVGIIKHGCATELRAVLADAPAEQRNLNCPVCGNGEEGACICALAEQIAEAEWNASGLAVREGPWSAVGIIKRRSLIIKALPEAAEQRGGA